MAELRSTSFWVGNITTVNPSKTTIYTVPTGRRIIVKDVTMRNLWSGGSLTVYFFVGGVLVHSQVLGSGGSSTDSADWKPWIVVDEGSSVQMAVTNATGAGVAVSGSDHYI